jgi:hypothetical protein
MLPVPAKMTTPSRRRRDLLLVLATVILVVLIEGSVGWVLPSVGGSVLVPALIVFGIGASITLVASVMTRRQPMWKTLAMVTSAVTTVTSIWTFQFSLPAQVEFSNASAQAVAALSDAQRSPLDHHGTVPYQPCSLHATGSVGPLPAPYRECVTYTPEGHSVRFNRVAPQSGGLAYVVDTGRDVDAFPDQCVRPLIGHWSMVTAPESDSSPLCPIGYEDSGGG